MGRLESLPFIDVFEVTREQVVAYDLHTETDFAIHFAESFSKEQLEKLVHITPQIPEKLRFDRDKLAAYLWEVMDHNAFLTLNGLWFVCSEEDYRKAARFYDCDEAILLPEYDAMGCMWFSRQVCIVDVGRIVSKYPSAEVGQLRRELVVTTLHELRHLMLDTNPALPADQYPLELGSEFLVERYAQELCDDGRIANIFN